MPLIDGIAGPDDLKGMRPAELEELAAEIRGFLVENVSRTGGHLGPNLGVVELTIALHRVFDSPSDILVFDTGHQSYVHKILTGRHDFSSLRQEGGLSGYPARSESPHDVVENSHATTALSWADGIARGFQMDGNTDRRVVAVIGDGAMTGGMAWEALNNIAQDSERPIVIVLNDNGRSYAPTVGGIVRRLEPVRRLDELRVNKNYENLLDWTKRRSYEAGMGGKVAYGVLHSFKKSIKDMLIDAGVFDYLGMKYIGPVDGHRIGDLIEAFTLAKAYGGPIVVHAITEKGRGYEPAELNKADHFHAIGQIHPETGLPIVHERFGWTSVFAEEMREAARKDKSLVGITAAMLEPVGLGPMKKEFPKRVIDVGIAEQHAVTMAAGLAHQGYHPVLALYATFLNRGFDQLLMDVALHRAPVTVMLDRSGVTGSDGPSHNGMWDLSLGAMIPGLKVGAPRDGARLRALFREAIATKDGPTLIRYPKGALPEDIEPVKELGFCDVVHAPSDGSSAVGLPRVAVVAVGSFVREAMKAAGEAESRAAVTVLDPKWVLPVSDDLVAYLAGFDGVAIVEDGLVDGGVGSEVVLGLAGAGAVLPVECVGISKRFLGTATRDSILGAENMLSSDIADAIGRIAARPTAGAAKDNEETSGLRALRS